MKKFILNPELMCVISDNKVFLYNRIKRISYKIKAEYLLYFQSARELTNKNLQLIGIQQLIKEKIIIEDKNTQEKCLIRYRDFDYKITDIQIEVTTNCNFKCIHCYLNNETQTKYVMAIEDIYNIVDEASELGVVNVDITGGEPLLYKEIKEILSYIYRKGMKSKLFTNGYLLNDDYICFFKTIGIDCVRISLDGLEKEQNAIRRKDCFNKIVNNIEKLRKNHIPVHISTVAMRENVKILPNLIEMFKYQEDVIESVDSYLPVGINDIKHTIHENEYAEIVKLLLDENVINRMALQKHYCGLGNSYFFISAKGIGKLCPTLPDKFALGNIRKSTLKDMISNLKKFDNITCKNISECKYAKWCKGGCRSRAYAFENDIYGKDKYMCEVFKTIKG